MNGFIGARSAEMLCTPFKGKAGLASIFAKTRRIGWDVSLGQMRFLKAACGFPRRRPLAGKQKGARGTLRATAWG